MKILFIAPMFPHPQESGSQIRMYQMCKYLAARHTLHLACISADAQKRDNPAGICHRYISLPPSSVSRWSRLTRIVRMHPFTPSASIVNGIRQLAASEKYNAVIAAKTIGGFYALEAGLPKRSFVVLEEGAGVHHLFYKREFYRSPVSFYKARAFIQWQKMLAFERTLVRKVNLTVAVSSEEKNIIRRMAGEDKVILTPNGVDTKFFSPMSSGGAKTSVVFMGSYGYAPNIRAARFAIAEILPALPGNVSLVITGKSPPADMIQEAVANPRIHVTGFVPDIRPLLRDAVAFINPMWEGAGTRLKVLHAMAIGCPVISTSIGAEGIDYTSGENILLAETAFAFARQVKELLQDPIKAASIGRAGRALVEEKYDWEKIFESFEEELINRTERHAENIHG
jgi:glycosyltransferase involved in cell wall biosynthesis